jgi:hypothetical protein
MAKFKVSKYGQWEYPGQPTAVPTEDGRITMQGVPYPVMGFVPGQSPIIMQPGGNYQFPEKMVYEIPMAYGGDISIPDLSRPNWLDKAQKGQQVKYYDDLEEFGIANRNYNDSLEGFKKYPLAPHFRSQNITRKEFLSENNPATSHFINGNYSGANILNSNFARSLNISPSNIRPTGNAYEWVYKRPTQQPVYKEKPKEFIPTKIPRLEREPVELVMPQSDRTLMPYNNTLQVLHSIQHEDRDKQGPKVVPAPEFKSGGWLYKYQDGSEVIQKGPELNQVNISAEKPNAIKSAWNNFERSKYNPFNLFLDDMSMIDEQSAFDVARQMGRPDYMYKGKRYSTKMDWLTPQEQLEQTGITDDQLHRRGFFEKRLSNNLEPLGYGMGDQSQFDRFWNAAIKNEKDPEKALRDLGIEDPDTGEIYGRNRTDAYNLYTGLPQKYNTFSVSKYKPSRAKDSDVVYYSINDLANNKDFKRHVVEEYNSSKSTIDRIAKEKNWSNDKLDYLKKRYNIQYDRDRVNEGLNPGQGLNDKNLDYIFSRVFYGDSDVSKNDKATLKAFFKDIGEGDLANNIDQVIKSSRDLVVDSPYFTKLNDISNDIIGQLGGYDPKTASYNFSDSYAGVMGNYNLSKGIDPETGREYVSYRDKWDIDPVDFGKPFEIYDRIYFDDPDLVVPQQKNGGWLDRYQDGKQVKANIPGYNPEVGPTVKNAQLLQEQKLQEAARNSPSLNLPSGAIDPALSPIDYAFMPSLAAPIIKAAMAPKAPVDTELEAIRKILRKNVTYPKQTGPLTETPPWSNRFLDLGDDAWVIGNMERGRTSVPNPDADLPGRLPKPTPKRLPGVNGTSYPDRLPKEKYGGWLDNY